MDTERPLRAVVGVGASAGGLKALEAFFGAVSERSDATFVVVTHQQPETHSTLAELLAAICPLPVREIDGDVKLEPGTVYVAVGGHEFDFDDGRLLERSPTVPRYAVIDRFFRSLSEAHEERAIAVIMSGGGSDGAVGAEAVKGRGGLVAVQSLDDAEHPEMPGAARSQGVVDIAAPAADLPGLLGSYIDGPFFDERDVIADADEALHRTLVDILKAETGVDFHQYKEATILRRIERRMNLRAAHDLADYVDILKTDSTEIRDLFQDLLIGVTAFFRDPDVWDTVSESVIEPLIESKERGEAIRAWVPGCSTGEEAYTVAMLLAECADRAGKRPEIKVFGTDVNEAAIAKARTGRYPAGIVDDVAPDRLERHFVLEDSGYRVSNAIRELVVFARHDVLADPPFSDLDIISCRNLLIYLQHGPRDRLLPTFHYALARGGFLILGPSESLGAADRLFAPLGRSARVFRRRDVESGHLGHVGWSSSASPISPGSSRPVSDADRVLLDELIPPTVLCRRDGTVLHIHGRTGKYLEPSPGSQVAVNLIDMVREGLRSEVSTAIYEAWQRRPEVVRVRDARVKTNGNWELVDIVARAVRSRTGMDAQVAVSFHDVDPVTLPDDADSELNSQNNVEALRDEVRDIAGDRQLVVERLEVANEELRSLNEELQSTNEELQSSNEELKTSKEEVQSLNEELRTVNGELERKVELLSRANDDMKNLLDGTEIATLFLDNNLHIQRYTERATQLVNLIPSDVGRNVEDLSMSIDRDAVIDTAREVVRSLQFRQLELKDSAGCWHLMRVVPYRTDKNVIDGIVISFVDISELKKLQLKYDRLIRAIETSPVAVAMQDEELKYRWVVGRPFDLEAASFDGRTDEDLFDAEQAARLMELKNEVLGGAGSKTCWLPHGDGRATHLYVEASTGDDEPGKIWMVSMTVDERRAQLDEGGEDGVD